MKVLDFLEVVDFSENPPPRRFLEAQRIEQVRFFRKFSAQNNVSFEKISLFTHLERGEAGDGVDRLGTLLK